MKKIMAVLICMLTLSGCAGTVQKPAGVYFTAKVAAVYEKSLLIETTDSGNSGMSVGTPAYISRSEAEESYSAGDVLKITFDGVIMETYPAQLGKIYSVEKIQGAVVPDWGITLTAENVTASGLTVVCTHSGDSDKEFGTGTYYVIEQKKDGSWLRVGYKDLSEWEVGWDELLYIINCNEKTEIETDWKWLYGELSTGEYRIGKEIMCSDSSGRYEKAMLYAEFKI